MRIGAIKAVGGKKLHGKVIEQPSSPHLVHHPDWQPPVLLCDQGLNNAATQGHRSGVVLGLLPDMEGDGKLW